MADLALELAKSTVDGTLSLVKAAIKEEDDLRKSVKRELLLITEEFEMMRSFLNDTKKHVSSNMARTMVRQVRDMSLDVEDCVEYVVPYTDRSSWLHRLLPRWQCLPTARPVICLDDAVENIELLKARVESMGQRKMRYNHVGESAPKAAEQAHQQALAITATPHVLVKSSDTASRLKRRVNLVKLINSAEEEEIEEEEISEVDEVEEEELEEEEIREVDKVEEEKVGKKGRDKIGEEEDEERKKGDEAKKDKVEKKGDKIEEEEEEEIKEGDKGEEEKNGDKVEEEGKVQAVTEPRRCWQGPWPPLSLVQAEAEEQQEKEQNRELQVISVLATRNDDVVLMSIKKAYDDHQTSKGFTCRAWVKLMHPFDPHVFMRSLLAQFYSSYDEKDDTMDIMELEELMVQTDGALIGKFKKKIKRKYLVVLEDVSSMADWKGAKAYLPDYNNGSSIIVHTQQIGIAGMSVGHLHQVSELKNTEHPVYVVYKTDKETILKSTNKTKAAKEEAASKWLNEFTFVCHQKSLATIDFTINNWSSIAFVFSVWGIPGVGKSTLVKRAYNTSIKKRRYSNFGWVDISYPFNLKDFLWSLLVDLQSESSLSIWGIKDPIQGCRQFLQENKCLIVIDGLQSTDEWDLIRNVIAPGKTKSSIIVSTSEERVARYCATPECFFKEVECLEADHALDLWTHKQKRGSPNPCRRQGRGAAPSPNVLFLAAPCSRGV